jgi:sulfite reductase (ferredoxin)
VSNQTHDGKGLADLGPGEGSSVERLKLESRHLRGRLLDDLHDGSRQTLSSGQEQIIKFHGIYQQEDRDARATRKAAGQEKVHNFMVRSRIPGGVLTAQQYLVEDDIAGRFGNQTMRITARQGFQLHGVIKGDLQATIKPLLVLWRNERSGAETFGDFAHRVGVEYLRSQTEQGHPA